jgi:hypoxanthine phosphoribosyltransferase
MAKNLTLLISQAEIAQKVKQLAQQIDQDYQGQSLTIIGILKGSFIFLADLVRAIATPLERIEFLQLSSYGSSTVSSGKVTVLQDISPTLIHHQHILLVEDIIDTGLSIATVLERLQTHQPASLKLCTLLNKPSCRRQDVQIDYCGFSIPDHFVLGYGLDLDQKYRQLPAIYYLPKSES